MTKVILNALPPARIDTPSAALSILKAFLLHHGIETGIVYWNLRLDRLMPASGKNTDMIHYDLLPYLYRISEEYDDGVSKAKANAEMKSLFPFRDLRNDNSDYFGDVKNILDEMISRELSTCSDPGQLLFGISCKYEQWVSGIVLATWIKKNLPGSRIVIGGLRNREKAESLLKICRAFDYAIWGEGEYPLLELCRAIDGGTGDFHSVPRLVFRKGDVLQSSDTDASEFFDMNSGITPDYDDYFRDIETSIPNPAAVILPLESGRGCTWNACRFCVYGKGYKTRKKDHEVLKKEILHLLEKYKTPFFAFMDNDIVANDPERLENILDDLISIRESRNIHFIAEVIPKQISRETIRKFPGAGLGQVHFGYESLSDSLLTKMRKRTNFSDNLFFIKFARKYNIKLPSANIIQGAIGETDTDILECIDNLHFLRFYFDKHRFRHNLIPLRVAKYSGFYDMIEEDKLIQWDENRIFGLLPRKMVEGIDRFSLFDFSSRPNFLWELFSKINDFYYGHAYSYGISVEDGRPVYREYFDGELVVERGISDLERRILERSNASILDLDGLLEALGRNHPEGIDEGKVRAALNRLKEGHLVYFQGEYRSIISVLDVDQVS